MERASLISYGLGVWQEDKNVAKDGIKGFSLSHQDADV